MPRDGAALLPAVQVRDGAAPFLDVEVRSTWPSFAARPLCSPSFAACVGLLGVEVPRDGAALLHGVEVPRDGAALLPDVEVRSTWPSFAA